jgi:CDP-2,3-bis-(O-geranylgeranyl)-sn-glycerol synthase
LTAEASSSSLLREALATAALLLPLLGGALFHGLCMQRGWFAFLATPIDRGRTFRGRPLFGHSKTVRGPLAVAAGVAAVWALEQALARSFPELAAAVPLDLASLPGVAFAAAAGAAAELSELPNSFVKRQLGIAPGGTTRGPLAVVFYLWDQLDLLLGYWLVLSAAVDVTPARVAVSLVVVGGIHPLLTLAGYLLGMRPTAR